MDYTELKTKAPIWVYSQNRTLVDEMPRLIKDAEDQLYLRFDHDLYQTVVNGLTFTKDVQELDLSAIEGLLEVRAIRYEYRTGDWVPLERRDLEMLTMLYSQRPGLPRYYAEYGALDKVRIFPTPRRNFNAEVTCNVQPARLSDAAPTNIITDKFPRVIDRAVLRQAAIFMKNREDEARYEKEMEAALQEANLQIARRRRDETDVRPRETANATGQ